MIPVGIFKLIWRANDSYYLKCSHCNYKNPVNASICHSCGAPLEANQTPPMTVHRAYILRPLSSGLTDVKSPLSTRDFAFTAFFLLILLYICTALTLFLGIKHNYFNNPALPLYIFIGVGLVVLAGLTTATLRWNKGRKTKTAKPFNTRYNWLQDTVYILIIIAVTFFSTALLFS